MGKLIYLMNVSLDGFVETPDHSLDWATIDDELPRLVQRPDARRSTPRSTGVASTRAWRAYWPTGRVRSAI